MPTPIFHDRQPGRQTTRPAREPKPHRRNERAVDYAPGQFLILCDGAVADVAGSTAEAHTIARELRRLAHHDQRNVLIEVCADEDN